ncbi:uncharacterized protein isoform X2 [Choristoneura fumiferana]
MTTSAINKTKHWITHQLQDPQRCRIFYEFYKKSEFQLAMKFFRNCGNEYLLEEFENIVTRIKPKQLKILSEKCPQLTKTFYERIKHDRDLLKHYLEHEKEFLNNLKYLLKSDPDTFFDILERYYYVQKQRSFGSVITHHIMIHHREKYFLKPELYTVYLLNMNALAKCLSPEEAKDLVVKLAHAAYLENWFTYKTVEPLILQLDKDEREALKKMIFVNKELGVKIKDWPYKLPTSPVLEKRPKCRLFLDKDCYSDYGFSPIICRRGRNKMWRNDSWIDQNRLLFNELLYRYQLVNFETTFFELQTRLSLESCPQNRLYMMLVLVRKSGGHENSVRTLFGLLTQYKNESVHLRAAIVRSLVKHAFAWRLPEDLWNNLLDWANGLGLDGSQREAACDEGLHAVVLRDFLANKISNPSVLNAFFNNLFTNFTKYSLTASERCCVQNSLLNLLVAKADTETGDEKLKRFNQALDTLEAYKVPFNAFPSVITAIATAAEEDIESYEDILQRLFVARAGRKQLFKLNFLRIQNNASFMNALRHDITVLDAKQFNDILTVDTVIYYNNKSRFKFDQFLQKITIYFSEDGGLAKEFYAVLKHNAETEPHWLLARPLALLAGNDLTALLNIFDCDTTRRLKTAKQSLSAALRANGHVSRPPLDLNVICWKAAGVKAVGNMLSICPKTKQEEMIAKLMTWPRALRVALAFTVNDGTKHAIFKSLVASRPGAALKTFLQYLKRGKLGNCAISIWNEVKPLITKLDFNKYQMRLEVYDDNILVPEPIKSEYYKLVYKVYISGNHLMTSYNTRILDKIENICSELDETFLFDVLKSFLENDFTPEKILVGYNFPGVLGFCNKYYSYISIIAKFLLLCSSEEIQTKRLEIVGELFFASFKNMWKSSHDVRENHWVRLLFEFLTMLKYNRVIFDDVKYVSCMPVYERVVSWMQSFLCTRKRFDVYVYIHLTMLYHKAAKYCIKQKPEYFKTDSTRLEKGVEMFGAIFGKIVAYEYEELKLKYCWSIKEIYENILFDFFVTSLDLNNHYDESKEKFAIAFVESVLAGSKTKEAHLIAFHIFYKVVKIYFKYDYDLSQIINILKGTNNNELSLNFHRMLNNERCSYKIKRFLNATIA